MASEEENAGKHDQEDEEIVNAEREHVVPVVVGRVGLGFEAGPVDAEVGDLLFSVGNFCLGLVFQVFEVSFVSWLNQKQGK